MTTTTGTHLGAFTPLDWAMFLSIGLIWGSSFLLIAIGLDAFDPGLITWLRIIFGASVLWLVPAARKRIPREDFPRLVAISVLWVAIPFTLFPFAEQRITSGLTGLVNGALPIFAVAIGSLMLRRPPGRAQAWGLAVGFLGVAAIAVPSISEGSSEAIGFVMALVATLCYGFAINIATPLTQRYGSLPVMARMLGSRLDMDAAARAVERARIRLLPGPRSWPSRAWAIVGTGVAFVLMGRLVARVGSSRASFATYLDPRRRVDPAVWSSGDETVHLLSVIGHRARDRWAPCSPPAEERGA